MHKQVTPSRAFTLIELLIVVLIIAILAAIAVPNFLEFQTRAKVSRAKSDMRSLAIALEAYVVDNNVYPPDGDDIAPFNPLVNYDCRTRLSVLTTPIAYFSSLPEDPFHTTNVDLGQLQILFTTPAPFTFIYNTYGSFDPAQTFSPGPSNGGQPDNWTLTSLGPSRQFDQGIQRFQIDYDPTNGTVSLGDINYSGGTRVQLESTP